MTEQQLEVFSEEDIQLLTDLEHLTPEQRSDVISGVPEKVATLMALFESELSGAVKDPTKHAQRLVFALANYMGGVHTYLPRNDRLIKLMRDISIYKDYNKGISIKALSEKHRLTDVMIYSIIREHTLRDRARRKAKTPDLFPETLEEKN